MHLLKGGQVENSPPVRVGDLKRIYRRRLGMAADGITSPPEDLVLASRAMLDRLEFLRDDDSVSLELQPDTTVFRAASSGEVIGELPRHSDLGSVREWFAAIGFDLSFERVGDTWWAALVRVESQSIVAPRYGRGVSQLDAARRAQERYRVEEVPPGI
jgi:hypothetical protein